MMRIATSAAALALVASPGLADQVQPSTAQPAALPQASAVPAWKRSGDGGVSSEALALEALHNYASCAVKRTPDGAARLLDLDVNGAPYRGALARFAKGHSYCVSSGRMQFNGLPFQGALVEALLVQRFAERPLPNAVASASASLKPRFEPEAIGLCLVRKRTEATTALLASQPASEQEHAALNQIVDVLPGCVVSGMTMKMNRPAVRAMMALGAYRLQASNSNPAES